MYHPAGLRTIVCRTNVNVYRAPVGYYRATFTTNSAIQYRGFQITISQRTTPCHTIIDLSDGSKTSGLISSPSFPRRYPANSQCEWWIQAPTGNTIRLHLRVMKLRYSSGCYKSYVAVDTSGTATYDPSTTERICGRHRKTFVSTGTMINVAFEGGSRRTKGFRAFYTVV
ncbi:hypothetical protein Pcinc_016484 [Petrolisthes cinctipes]|uniref:CUB domain-containing protein n=1 Tax=Petrolisthes cinctipes TaxID=88211 RepID=A0AAE1FSV2_PETCI|nr:hypothetical protein Pcinc_016484 [Petrolisthes cinctipes]